MSPHYSVIVPVYNEESILRAFYARLSKVVDALDRESEMLFVNDGSEDQSESILKELHQKDHRVKIIHLSRNFGHQMAITAGIDHCHGKACIIMDADLQDPPELIPEMIRLWQTGYEVVYAVRKKRQGETRSKLLTAFFFYQILSKFANIEIPQNVGDFRLLDQKVVHAFRKLPERNRFVRGLVSWLGFNQTNLFYERDPRIAGETKYPLKKMIKFAFDGITSFSYLPLKLATWMGLLFSLVSFLLVFWVIGAKIFTDRTVLGWASLMVAVLLIGGVQLFAIGILGEYIGRIFDEVKQRPLYLIRQKVGFE
jgi:glycosyltransferase involved in cell wall biosynthesis